MKFKELYGKTGAAVIRLFIKAVYRPVSVDKPENCGPVIYVTYHSTRLDGLMMLACLEDEKPYALTAKDWHDIKVLTPIFDAARSIPINRHGLDTSWLHTSAAKIRENRGVIIFPEGHTVHSGDVEEFKSGFAVLSRLTGAKIMPVWHGKYRAFRKNYIRFGELCDAYRGAMAAGELSEWCAGMRQKVIDIGNNPES